MGDENIAICRICHMAIAPGAEVRLRENSERAFHQKCIDEYDNHPQLDLERRMMKYDDKPAGRP